MNKREYIEEQLAELNEQALFMDGHDDAIVGVTATTEPVVVYSEQAIIDGLILEMVSDGMDYAEAEENAWDHYGFNIQGSLVGDRENYPIIIRTIDESV